MPAVDDKGRPIRVRAKKKVSQSPAPVPDRVDDRRQPRPAPPPVKVRAYAHPQRSGPQKAMKEAVTEQEREKVKRAETRAVVGKIRIVPVPSPDARDSERSPAQRKHDAAFVAKTVRETRERVLREQGRGAGVRLVQHVASEGERAAARIVAKLPQTGQEARVEKQATTGGRGGGPLFAVITSRVAANTPGLREIASATPMGTKFVGNTAADAAELGITTPSSLAKLGSTAVHHPAQVPGLLVQPYEDLAAHPGKFAYDRPLTTAMMLDPAVRMPGRVLGRAARLTGKQTLERPAASLPETALQEPRTGSRDFVVRAVQARHDKRNPAPKMTRADVETRVDEFRDFAVNHTARVVDSAAAQARRKAHRDGLSKADTAEAIREKVKGARGGARNQVDERFGREFGAVHQLHPRGLVTPKGATEGALHDTRATAQAIADRLNGRGTTIGRGAHGFHERTSAGESMPLEFVVHPAGDKFAVVPKIAVDRLVVHGKIGVGQALGAKMLRTAGQSFRNAVLPLSVRWLAGQAIEAGVRSAVAGAGPLDVLRINRVVKRMNAQHPGAGDELLMRVTGGQFGLTGTAREFAEGRSLGDEFANTALRDPARALTRAGATRPARVVRAGWQRYTNVVFNTVNGAFENTARKAMAGQAIRGGELMEHRIIGLSDRAIADAANGLRGTHAQVQLGRAVDRMYGQYQKFSPDMREMLLHNTPFLPWYLNTVRFLTKTLPVDHPIKAALVADASATEEEWRKSHGLTTPLKMKGGKPGFLLGGYPVGSGEKVIRYGRYTPVLPGDPLEALGDLVLPQFGGVKEILHGHDFAGRDIKGNRVLVALDSLAEAHTPGLGQLGRITGLPGHYVRLTDEPTVFDGKSLVAALRKEVDPFNSTGGTPARSPRRVRRAAGAYSGAVGSAYDTGYSNAYGGN